MPGRPAGSTTPPARGAASTAGSTPSTHGCCASRSLAPAARSSWSWRSPSIASSVPLYRLVSGSTCPTDVDEAEFEVIFERPEGTSLAAMDEVGAGDGRARSGPSAACGWCCATAGGSFLGGVNQGGVYVRIAPHAERGLGQPACGTGSARGDPLAAFRGNYTQRDVMQEVRQRLRKFRDLRITVRNIAAFNIGGGNFDIDFVLRGPDLDDAGALRRRAARAGAGARRIVDADTTFQPG